MSNNMDKQSYIDEAEKELLHTYNRFHLYSITAREYIFMIQTAMHIWTSPQE